MAISGISLSMYSGIKQSKVSKSAAIIGILGMVLSAIGGRIWCCVDAVRKATSEVIVPVKKS